ncbi:MAG: NAD(P)/FAD-dependent oxidoreductase [Bacteroidota bacterium]|nr:NAD(P)/FAD-dependent oxidoreductase [Bacteroidota bacterium]
MSKKITIVGAGLVGSLSAIYMSQRGYKVDIYERRNDLRADIITAGKSINLALSERGWKALKKVGVHTAVKEIAIPMEKRIMHDLEGGIYEQMYGNPGQAIFSVSRVKLNVLMMDLAEKNGVNLFFNEKCIDIDPNIPHVILENTDNGSHKTVVSDIIIGADGAFSRVRSQIVKKNKHEFSDQYIKHGYKELLIPANKDGSYKLDKNGLHIWPRGDFMLIALANLDGSFTCTLFAPFKGVDSFETLKDKDSIEKYFEKMFPDFYPLINDLYKQFQDNPTSSLGIIKTYPWHVQDKVILLGDSAHATVPFYGQGMNCGFEDCRILDKLLDKYSSNIKKAFKEYSLIRKPNGDGLQSLSMHNFVVMRDKTADPLFLLQKKIEQKFAQKYPEKWTPLYSMVSFTNIPYSEAWEIGMRQENLMKTIMEIDDIAEKWDTEEIMQKMYNFM